MKKKFKIILASALLLMFMSSISTAFAVWLPRTKSEQQSVRVDTFIDLKLSGNVADGSYSVEHDFTAVFTTVKYLNDGENYCLKLCEILFYADAENTNEWNEFVSEIWEFTYFTDPPETYIWQNLAETVLIPNVENGSAVTVLLRIKQGALKEYILGTLSFSAKLQEIEEGK